MEAHFAGLERLHITIAGLGLMGGSLALALREHWSRQGEGNRQGRLSGVETDPAAQSFALAGGLVDEIVTFEQALRSDLLVLAAPVSGILAMLESMRHYDPPGALIVLDLGSTKAQVVEAMQKLPAGYNPIGGHPMCGKETSGAVHAEASLYEGCTFILSPLGRTTTQARELALALIQAVGGNPLFLAPGEHDHLVAYASHVPYLAAAALVKAAETSGDERVWQVAASGFRDTTRLAASNLEMMSDILLTNSGPVLEALTSLRTALDSLAAIIQNNDARALQAALEPMRLRRSHLS